MPASHCAEVSASLAARLDRLPITPAHRVFAFTIAVGTFFEIYETFLSGVLASLLKDTFNVTGLALSLVVGSSFLGAFLGAFLVAPVADRLGRRQAFLISVGLYSLFSVLCAIAPNVTLLIVFRFLCGVGLGAEIPVMNAYFSELLPPRQRGSWSTYALTIAYLAAPTVGILSFVLVPEQPLGIDGWRWMFILGAGGAAITALMRRTLPESPRWLVTVGRYEEAEAVVQRLEASANLRYEGDAIGLVAGDVPVAVSSPRSGSAIPHREAFDIVRQPPFLRRFLLVGLLWIVGVIGYFGFSNIATLSLQSRGFDVTGSLLFSGLSFAGYPLGCLLAAFVMDRVERKHLLIIGLLGMATFGVPFGTSSHAVVITICGFLFTLTANIAAAAVGVYTSEQFPTKARATIAGTGYSLGRLSSGITPFYLIPMLSAWGAGVVFGFVTAVLASTAVVLALFGIRTKNKSVDELADALVTAKGIK